MKELSLKLGKYWQKALNLLEIYHSSKNTKYLKFQADASTFTDTILKPEFWTFFLFLSIYGGEKRYFDIY